jgi:hypothetical protein
MAISEQQELHRLYGKHQVTKYWRNNLEKSDFSHLGQCACGDFFVLSSDKGRWEPMVGNVAATFMSQYPELYHDIKAYWATIMVEGHDFHLAWEKVCSRIMTHVFNAIEQRAPIMSLADLREELRRKEK